MFDILSTVLSRAIKFGANYKCRELA